ncbi:hypothetical protein MJO29_008835 [Puccinia striiformis f. sp. tritici]|nr:hypothetical protein MJO29_008835 [Puccinia striiformis f. sp. tritici]
MSKKTMHTVHPNQDLDGQLHYQAQMNPRSACPLSAVQQTRGWAVVGEQTPRVLRKRSTHQFYIIPAILMSALVAHIVQEENKERFDFEFFLENILLPCMNPFLGQNSVLVMDNTSIHHDGRVAEIIESRGCILSHLPPYSPDLNPIEKGFSAYKQALQLNKDLLTGGEGDFFIIDEFVRLVFTSELTQKTFPRVGLCCVLGFGGIMLPLTCFHLTNPIFSTA